MQQASFESISGFEMTHGVRASLAADGITAPTAVQSAAIAAILQGRDVRARSGTGTGKTLAYLLPVLQRLRSDPESRAIVYAPGVELAMQVLRVADRYKDPDLYTMALVSSGNLERQKERLKRRPRLIVGTPGRILEMVQARKLRGVNIVVLDEPDPLLSERNAPYLREVLSRPEPPLQLIMVAATMGPKSVALADALMDEGAVTVDTGSGPLHTHIAHFVVVLREETARDVQLARLLEERKASRAIVFVNSDRAARHLFRYLGEHRLRPRTLTDARSKRERELAVAAFKAGEARVLVTTDLAARGIDVPAVDWVVHYDLPTSAEGYLHRAGRTGRAGRKGASVALISDRGRPVLKRYAKELGIDIGPLRSPPSNASNRRPEGRVAGAESRPRRPEGREVGAESRRRRPEDRGARPGDSRSGSGSTHADARRPSRGATADGRSSRPSDRNTRFGDRVGRAGARDSAAPTQRDGPRPPRRGGRRF